MLAAVAERLRRSPRVSPAAGSRVIPSPADRAGAVPARGGLRRWGPLAVALALWLALTALFILTYPLNTAGDSMNYVGMILHLKSNLVHASGYPFVIGHLLRLIEPQPAAADGALWDAAGPADAAQMATLLRILTIQHAVHALVVVGCALFLLRAFGSLVAVAVVVLWGMSPFFLSEVSTAFPEWMQGDVLFVTACLCAVAFFAGSGRKKVLAYSAGGAMLGLAFLIKYNSLVFGVIFLALLLFETIPWRLRGLAATGAAVAFALVAGLHFFLFHYPSTRARSFQYESGWLLMERLDSAFGKDALEGSSGIHSLRYRALVRAIPRDYMRAHAFWHVDDVAPPEVRASYRPVYDRIMAMPASELVDLLSRDERPADFQLWVSVIPLCHYVGLAEGDALATRVFLEFVRDNPWRFATAVARGVLTSSLARNAARPRVPLDPAAGGLLPTGPLASGYVGYMPAPPQTPLTLLYWSPRLILWEPGLRLFKAVHAWCPTPPLEVAAYLILVAGVLFRRADREKKLMTALLLALLCFVVFHSVIHYFRPKEAAAAWPLACLLWAVAIRWTVQAVSLVLVRLTAGTADASVPSRAVP